LFDLPQKKRAQKTSLRKNTTGRSKIKGGSILHTPLIGFCGVHACLVKKELLVVQRENEPHPPL
jgi:hypothetical protein